MRKETKEPTKYGVCQVCGKQVVLPCESCQAEALRLWRRKNPPILQEEKIVDLSLRLWDPDLRQRYEEVRNFRDTHGYPMWSEQWRKEKARQAKTDKCQKIS